MFAGPVIPLEAARFERYRLLVRLLPLGKQKGGSVKLIQPSRPTELALKMCNVLPLFEVYAEEEQALASFSVGPASR